MPNDDQKNYKKEKIRGCSDEHSAMLLPDAKVTRNDTEQAMGSGGFSRSGQPGRNQGPYLKGPGNYGEFYTTPDQPDSRGIYGHNPVNQSPGRGEHPGSQYRPGSHPGGQHQNPAGQFQPGQFQPGLRQPRSTGHYRGNPQSPGQYRPAQQQPGQYRPTESHYGGFQQTGVSQQTVVKNPRTNIVPEIKNPEMNDRDNLNEILATEKYLTGNFNIFLHEASHLALFNDLKMVINESHDCAREIFNLMFKDGFYALKAASKEELQQEQQKFSNYLNCQDPYQQRQ